MFAIIEHEFTSKLWELQKLMSDDGSKRRGGLGGRKSRNTFTTRSGQTIKIHRNLTERIRASKDAAARRKAARLAGLPKSRVKRFFYHFHPKRMYHYWFSREGAIMLLKMAGMGIIVGFLLLVGIFAYFRKDLPNLKDISGANLGGSISYYDKTGQVLLWTDYNGVKRTVVADDKISKYVKQATVAVEDKDFYKHGGFDVRGIARAGVNDVMGKSTQGGSTITQQLVKLNNDWTKDRTITRKVKELILAVELERSYSKQEILDGYLNEAPYGNVQYGVEVASQDYFHKSAKDLTLAEAAFLAAIPKSPSEYSPYGYYYKQDTEYWSKQLVGRQHYVLDQMLDQGMITKAEHDEATKADTLAGIFTPQAKYTNIKAPWFVLTAKDELNARYGTETVKRGGWKVTTTLDMSLQTAAEEQVAKGLAQVKRQGGDAIGFAAEDVKTGQMVALVGGTDFNNEQYGQNNYARLKISPGSSFKPYDYTAFIDNNSNVGAGSVLFDTKGALPGYPCTTGVSRTGNCAIDYDLRYPGPLTLRYALGGSRNVPAMKAMLGSDSDPSTSVNKTIAVAKKLMQSPGTPQGESRGDYKCLLPGTPVESAKASDETQCGAASAIGDGAYLRLDEHVHGFASLSRNGLNIPQTYILKIEDSSNKIIDQWQPSKGVQVVRAESAYIVDDMISDPNASYLGSKPHRYKGWKFGFKTGTTNDSKDGLMMGMSTQYAAGVWVGYHDRTKSLTGFMENMTQPIVAGWMDKAHDNLKPVDRVRPSGIQVLPAFVVTTHVGVGSREPSPSTDLFPSWYKASKTSTSTQTIDTVSGKIATDCTPQRARKTTTGAAAGGFSVDKFVPGGGSATTDSSQQDDVHKCDDSKPTIQITGATTSSITVVVTAGTHPLSSSQFPGAINLMVDGQIVQSFPVDDSQASSPITLNYSYSGTGSKQVTAQVVDSVLYDASDQTGSLDFGGGSTPLTINGPSGNVNSSSTTISWSGGSGTYTVTITSPGSTNSCANITSTSCSVNLPSKTTYTATVKDSDNTIQTVTFKRV